MKEITIRELGPDLLEDYLRFFDDVAPAKEEWQGCYCYFYHSAASSAEEGIASMGAKNRAAVSDLIRQGVHQGLLAYADGKPVGWCLAAPRHLLRNIPRLLGPLYEDVRDVGSILCFVIAEQYRRQGVAGRLLAAACDRFATMGLTWAEGYPGRSDPNASHYHGPLPMFQAAGFTAVGNVEHYSVVRKRLQP